MRGICKKIYDFSYDFSKIINTYWTRPRPISKIIMLARSIAGDAEGGAHYLSCKHDNLILVEAESNEVF